MAEQIYEIVNLTLSRYELWGVILIALLLLLFIIQLCYYWGAYAKINRYRDKRRAEIRPSTPPVSVVVPLFTEDYPFLDERLPLIMAQEGVDFEVVLVYIGNDTDFYDDLHRLAQVLPNIAITKIQDNPRFPISVKTALNVGIKASKYEHMIFTTADSYPLSNRWLSLMAGGFCRGDLVLGYTGLEEERGVLRSFMRASQLMDAANWLSRAVKSKPYRGDHANIGWTKSLYNKARGFSHLNMNIGEDDLFVQKLLKLESRPEVSVILSPRATLNEKSWGGLKWWLEQSRFYRSSFALYPLWAKWAERGERASRVLFFIATLCAIITLPFEIKIASAVLFLLREVVMMTTMASVAKRLGERGLMLWYWLFDILNPIYMYALDISLKLHRASNVWR